MPTAFGGNPNDEAGLALKAVCFEQILILKLSYLAKEQIGCA